MRTVMLPDGTRTSQLGYGCAGLGGGIDMDTSSRLVRAALDAGIRHFDVAPIYGSGMAEDALGAALAGVSDQVTVTTKVGLARPAAPRQSSGLHRLARRALAFAPGLKARLGAKAYTMTRRKAFAIADVEASFCESLRRLRRERVDVLLLHEPAKDDLSDELLQWAESIKAQGRAGNVGFGASRASLPALFDAWPDVAFVQTSWQAEEPPITRDRPFLSIHGVLRQIAGEKPAGDEATARMAAALAHNPNGLVLFASSRIDRIATTAAVANRRPVAAQGEANT